MFSTKKSTYHTLIWRPEDLNGLEDYLAKHIPVMVENWAVGDKITAAELGGAIGSNPYTLTYSEPDPIFFLEFFQGDWLVKVSMEYVGDGSQRYYIHSISRRPIRPDTPRPGW